MRWLFQPLLLLVANSTESELAKQVEFLRAENLMLRRRIHKRIFLTKQERRLLVKLGDAIGPKVTWLLTIVAYQTYRRWAHQLVGGGKTPEKSVRKPGRPRTAESIRRLVLKLARENSWGYTRILGELRKLGIKTSRTNVVNILRENRLDPKLDSKKGRWAEFFKSHASTLWQCDFFSKHLVTPKGMRQCFMLAFLHVATRKVFLTPCTFKPDKVWMEAQGMAFLEHAKKEGLGVKVVVRDRDSKYGPEFRELFKRARVDLHPVNYRSPNMNAYIERFVQSIQHECLDKFIAFSQEHLDLLTGEFLEHYHHERPHQGKGNVPLMGALKRASGEGEIVCRERLGGVLRHYYRQAA